MRPFAAAVAVLLALVLAVNALAAVEARRRERRMEEAVAALRPGLALVFDGYVRERRFQELRLHVIPRPRVVALGSSRVREVSSEIAGVSPGEFYNLAMSAAAVEDDIALWSVLEGQGKVPELAIFSIDAWIFSAAHEQVRWLTLAPEVARFLEAAGAERGRLRQPARQAVHLWLEARELLSFEVFRRSLADLGRALPARTSKSRDLEAALGRDLVSEELVGDRHAIRSDGSLMRPATVDEPSTARLRQQASSYVAGGAYGLAGFRWDPLRAERLELLWRAMRTAGVRIVAYMPPYQPTAWALIEENPGYADALRSSAGFLRDLAGRVGARFLDLSDPASVPCGEEEFRDPDHAAPSCLRRIWQRLLPPAPARP
ncbi:MAG TPA: hypothetical protein VEL75_13565 [Candidatus Methylomirabilis sp.]|nr:hypothetical protein [Candidatus Methylomirabilis sp.]